MKNTLFATAAMAAMLGPVAFAAQKPAAKSTPAAAPSPATVASAQTPAKPVSMGKMHNLNGRIISITDTTLVVSHGRQKKESTFMLNPDTKREGTLTAGEMVKVEYRTQGKENIASLVQVQGLHAAASPSKAPKSSY
jgi:hypothetical protein